jgi:hypothetical protein
MIGAIESQVQPKRDSLSHEVRMQHECTGSLVVVLWLALPFLAVGLLRWLVRMGEATEARDPEKATRWRLTTAHRIVG